MWVEGSELYETFRQTGSIKGYLSDAWNVADWVVILVSFAACGMRLMFFFDTKVRNFDAFTQEYVELSGVATMYELSFSVDSIAAFLALSKLFKFFGLQRNLLILRQTISRAVGDLSIFTAILIVFIAAFAIAGNQIFGQENIEYYNMLQSAITCFRMILGDFDYEALERVNIGIALGYFWVYQIFVFFIMVNIFLAILNDAYLAIKEKFEEDKKLEPPGPPPLSVKQRIEKMRNWFRQRELSRRIEVLRSQERQRDLKEKREARKISDARAKTMKAIGLASAITDEARNDRSKGRAPAGEAAPPPVRAAAREDPQSALLRHEQL